MTISKHCISCGKEVWLEQYTSYPQCNACLNSKIKIIEKPTINSDHHTVVSCFCKKPSLITIHDEEIVCSKCGVVFGFEEYQNIHIIPSYHITNNSPKISLNMKNQKGGNLHDIKKIIKYKNLHLSDSTSSDLACFSDICEKLNLPSQMTDQCWRLYQKVKLFQYMTRAKTACLVIYLICRKNCIPYDEQNIRNIVCQSLGVKNAPKFKSIIFKLGKLGIILDEFEDKPESNGIADIYKSISSNSESKRQFYLNLHLSKAQKSLGLSDVTILQQLAMQYFKELVTASDSKCVDWDIAAKHAVSLACSRCGVTS